MSAEQNKATMQRLYDVIAGGNLNVIDEIIASSMIDHEELPGISGENGREMFRNFLIVLRDAFPDLSVEVHDMIAEGDTVASRITMRGTHQGKFLGIPASGNQMNMGVIDITRFADGKAVEHWGQSDSLGLLQQIGAIPAPEGAPT